MGRSNGNGWIRTAALAFLCATASIPAGDPPAGNGATEPDPDAKTAPDPLDPGVYAVFQTPRGRIVARLEYVKTPTTVLNFVGLAEGALPVDMAASIAAAKERVDHQREHIAAAREGGPDAAEPRALERLYADFDARAAHPPVIGRPYYDGVPIHRVAPGFTVQTGDPLGVGLGNPGYTIPAEPRDDLPFDRAGLLAMATERGRPDTAGGLFFFTLAPAPHLDGLYTRFGEVVEGFEALERLRVGDKIRTVRIQRIGEAAEAFVATPEKFAAWRDAPLARRLTAEAPTHDGKLAADDVAEVLERNHARAEAPDSGVAAARREALADMLVQARAAKPDGLGGLARTVTPGEGDPVGRGRSITGRIVFHRLDGVALAAADFETVVGERKIMPTVCEFTLSKMRVGETRVLFIPPGLAYGDKGHAESNVPPNATLYAAMTITAAREYAEPANDAP